MTVAWRPKRKEEKESRSNKKKKRKGKKGHEAPYYHLRKHTVSALGACSSPCLFVCRVLVDYYIK